MGKGMRRSGQHRQQSAVPSVVAASGFDPREQLRALDRLLEAYPGGLSSEFDAEDFANWVKRISGKD